MESKLCNSCGTVKPLDDFTRSKNHFKYQKSATRHAYCRQCNAVKAREWRKKNPGYRGTGKVMNIPEEDRMLMSAIRQRLTDARSRSKKLGKTAPAIDANYLYDLFKKQDRRCALTGALLVIEQGHPLCLSLDQKDPSKGYIEGNVQWLAWCVNRAKGDLAMSDFFGMCEAVLNHRKVQRLSP